MIEKLKITVLINNIGKNQVLRNSWGLSFFIQIPGFTVLFDTGDNQRILYGNMKEIGFSPDIIDAIFISHPHWDHTNGLELFSKSGLKNIPVYVPSSAEKQISNTTNLNNIIPVSNYREIYKNVYSTGEIIGNYRGSHIPEQGLIFNTMDGLILLVGCSHPGIDKIVEVTRNVPGNDRNIYLVAGGFHLSAFEFKKIKRIVEKLIDMKVERIAPSHCTGTYAIKVFKKYWSERFIELYLGDNFDYKSNK